MAPRISVVINTFNEEANLPYALRSVRPWADEIIVVDMHSEDRTVEIAREYGAQVFFHERMGFVEPARAFAVAQTTGDWVLILDADELIPAMLSQLLQSIARHDRADVIRLPRQNYLLGAPLFHTGYGAAQDRHIRFFKRGFLSLSPIIHSQLVPKPMARVYEIPPLPDHAIIHFNHLDTESFIEKMNRYTTIEARQHVRERARFHPLSSLRYAVWKFGVHYVKNQGFRDGWRGLYVSLFIAFYFLAKDAKQRELLTVGSQEDIRAIYRREAERFLTPYETTSARAVTESPLLGAPSA